MTQRHYSDAKYFIQKGEEKLRLNLEIIRDQILKLNEENKGVL